MKNHSTSNGNGAAERRAQRRVRSIIAYSVLGLLVIALGLYVGLRNRDRLQYELPSIAAPATTDVEAILVHVAGEDEFRLVRRQDGWFIEPQGYEASEDAVTSMVDVLAEFRITELVSTAGYYDRYDLDEGSRIHITALGEDGSTLLEFSAGKRSPSYNHTYVTVPKDDRVFQAVGDIRRSFDKAVKDIRDKVVMAFDPETVFGIHVTAGERTLRLNKTLKDEGDRGGESGSSQSSAVSEGVKTAVWTSSEGQEWDAEAVEQTIQRLSNLKCSRYAEDDESDLSDPILVVEVRGETTQTLFLFDKAEDDTYPARSSETPYAFFLSSWQGSQLIETFSAPAE